MSATSAVLDVPEIQDIRKTPEEGVSLKRLNINLTLKAYEEIQEIARKRNQSLTELVRVGLGLVKIAEEGSSKHLKLALVNKEGKAISEILIP